MTTLLITGAAVNGAVLLVALALVAVVVAAAIRSASWLRWQCPACPSVVEGPTSTAVPRMQAHANQHLLQDPAADGAR
ncbi:hypothetical protein [Auraticoccus monumenti]|uniref:Uncharacterized protein n=1 Tax=Auraticoccus monumenti TaxID=675864 RepID=A0A1G6URK2_9ACTN|nr:hypothetical protein [Auraticoccus monumenti]SDD43197.1 hypothetical protein SAMN04489747_0935 [Auraticoccus monumenti]